MADKYVDITRKDVESWLNLFPYDWRRKPLGLGGDFAGVYQILLSDKVAIDVSTTVTRSDSAMGRGEGSMQLRLTSLVTGETINKKAQGKSHFQRTVNWRDTVAEGVVGFIKEYMSKRDFYERIAADPRDQRGRPAPAVLQAAKVEKDLLRVEGLLEVLFDNPILKTFRMQLQRGTALSSRQERTLDTYDEVARRFNEATANLNGNYTDILRQLYTVVKATKPGLVAEVVELGKRSTSKTMSAQDVIRIWEMTRELNIKTARRTLVTPESVAYDSFTSKRSMVYERMIPARLRDALRDVSGEASESIYVAKDAWFYYVGASASKMGEAIDIIKEYEHLIGSVVGTRKGYLGDSSGVLIKV